MEYSTTTVVASKVKIGTTLSDVQQKKVLPRANFTGHLKEELVVKIITVDGKIDDVITTEKKYWVF